MTVKIITPNGGEDALEFGCSRTLNVAAVTATEISSGESKLELKTTTSGTIATKLTVTGAGNVGIGEAAPARRLEVTETSSSNFTGVRTNNPNTSTGQTGIEFQSDPTYCKAAIYQKRHAANGVGNLYFLVDTNADASNWEASDEKLRIQSDGQAIFSGTVTVAALNTSGNILQSKAGNTELMTLNTNGTVKGGLQALSNQSIRVGSTTNYPTEIVVNNAAKLTVGTNGVVTLAEPLPAASGGTGGTGGGGKVLQVVSTTKTDIFTISANTQADITGLAVTITPSLATSKILVTVHVSGSSPYDGVLMLYRGSSIVVQGGAAGVRSLGVSEFPATPTPGGAPSNSSAFLDSPATTSAITYKVAAKMVSGTGYINRSTTDGNANHDPRTVSTIYVMEIGA